MLSALLRKCSLLLIALLIGASAMLAQTSAPANGNWSSSKTSGDVAALPSAPSARAAAYTQRQTKPPYAVGGYAGPAGVHVACGGGLDLLQGRSQGVLAMCGAGFTLIPFSALEVGGVRLQDGSAHFYLSEDAIVPLARVIKPVHGEPIGILGYTKIVGNSNRLDYGVGWEHHIGPSQSLGLEVRDYVQFTNPIQHAIVFRLALIGGGDWAD